MFVAATMAALVGAARSAGSAPVPERHLVVDEEDPKTERNARLWKSSLGFVPPTIKLTYRTFELPNLDGSPMRMHAAQMDVYPISLRWFRFGVQAEVGGVRGELDGVPSRAWYLALGVSAGFQYPWRVTPFVDARFIAGFIGGDVQGQNAAGYIYGGGIDGGVEVYLTRRMYLTAAVGWVHPIYRGIDYAFMQANPNAEARFLDIASDAVTFKVGFGL